MSTKVAILGKEIETQNGKQHVVFTITPEAVTELKGLAKLATQAEKHGNIPKSFRSTIRPDMLTSEGFEAVVIDKPSEELFEILHNSPMKPVFDEKLLEEVDSYPSNDNILCDLHLANEQWENVVHIQDMNGEYHPYYADMDIESMDMILEHAREIDEEENCLLKP